MPVRSSEPRGRKCQQSKMIGRSPGWSHWVLTGTGGVQGRANGQGMAEQQDPKIVIQHAVVRMGAQILHLNSPSE